MTAPIKARETRQSKLLRSGGSNVDLDQIGPRHVTVSSQLNQVRPNDLWR
jgi:hypothetical protein